MIQKWDTVAIPFAAGIKPTSRGRVLDQARLLTAQNCFFYLDEGPQKRYGHDTREVKRTGTPPGLNGIVPPAAPPLRTPFSFANPGLDYSWLHGYGIVDTYANTATSVSVGSFPTSSQLQAGVLWGAFTRDDEALLWDGFRVYSAPDSMTSDFATVSTPAVFPALRGGPIAKSINGQIRPDLADNGVIKTVAWVHSGAAYRSVFDSNTGACLVNEEAVSGLASAVSLRVLTLGDWTHLIINDNTSELTMRSWHQDTPSRTTTTSLGDITQPVFDVDKIYEANDGNAAAIIARINAGAVECTVINRSGTVQSTWTPAITGTPDNVTIATSQDTAEVAIVWQITGTFQVRFCTYSPWSGASVSAIMDVGAASTAKGRITVAANWLRINGVSSWTAYVEDSHTNYQKVQVYAIASAVSLTTTRYATCLASHAFRCGQRTYVWCQGDQEVYVKQPTWFLCDEKLLPIGKVLFGLAYAEDTTTVFTMPGVNWTGETYPNPTPSKDRLVFMGALGYRQRANTSTDTPDPNGVWLEPSIFEYKLDFLPYIRTAQAGRSTYIAGAQLWEYDGTALNEAGFHLAPENFTVSQGAAGNLLATKTYSWRIDLCYKNAQNEEIRSWSSIVTLANTENPGEVETPTTFKAELVIPHVPMTRRDNAYFLIYRTEGNGTEYYLVSSRDPAQSGAAENGFELNARSAESYTFTDNLADTTLIQREYHPANATGYLQPFSAPACEVVAAGRDRLWVAGGELAPGEIAPSRYFQPGEVPLFTPALNIQIDRNNEPITAIGFVGEVAAFFRKTSAYTMESEGPDNLGQGVWGYPRLALADVGAVSQESLALAGEGLYFQSPAGIRVITPGGGLRPPGAGLVGGLGTDVDTLASIGTYAAAVVVPEHSQIRWYSRDPDQPTLVVDYTKNVWTTWTGLTTTGAVFWLPGNTVFLARGDGHLWRENPDKFLDGDRTYEMVIKTAWLHAAGMGDYLRARRFALFGEGSDGLSLRYRVYYDERPFHTDEGLVSFVGTNPTSKFNPSTWGSVSWGFGPWGDESAESNTGSGSGLWFRDGVFRFRRRFDRQKCSVFAIEFSDQGSNASFTPVVLALELGLKPGLDRIA
jgi:hypothetical protein